jgi:hypothetical protein
VLFLMSSIIDSDLVLKLCLADGTSQFHMIPLMVIPSPITFYCRKKELYRKESYYKKNGKTEPCGTTFIYSFYYSGAKEPNVRTGNEYTDYVSKGFI